MIHGCEIEKYESEIEKEPAELLVGWARPVDGEAGGDSIR